MKRLHQRGDTIVEVLLAIIIVSSVLAGAYISSSRSFRASRQAQERGEALKYVEAQLEQLKAASASNPAVFSSPYYCFSSSGTLTALSSAPSSDKESDDFSTARYPNACNFGTISGGYHMSVVPNADVFTVRARWDSFQGKSRDEVKIIYKLQP